MQQFFFGRPVLKWNNLLKNSLVEEKLTVVGVRGCEHVYMMYRPAVL